MKSTRGSARRPEPLPDMAKTAPYKLSRTAKADADIRDIRDYTVKAHGTQAAKAYNALLRQAFKDIREDPFRPGSRERLDIAPHFRSYHIALSSKRVQSEIKDPRHLIFYFQAREDEIVVSRILHESRDIARHLPDHDATRAQAFKESRKLKSREKGKGRER